MNIQYAVTTCERYHNYLDQTLESLEDAGIGSPAIVSDGMFQHPQYYDDICNPIRMGIKPTFKLALWYLSVSHRADWCVVFQDDIKVSLGLGEWLPENLKDGICSLYCSSVHDEPIYGWKQLDMVPNDREQFPWHRSLGACAIAMPKDVAVRFLKNDPQMNRNDRLGAALGEFAFRERIPFHVHCPSLVQHVGAVSVHRGMPITKEREAVRFCTDVCKLNGANS